MRKFLNISLLLVILLFSLGGCASKYDKQYKEKKRAEWRKQNEYWDNFIINKINRIEINLSKMSKCVYYEKYNGKKDNYTHLEYLYMCSSAPDIGACEIARTIEREFYNHISYCSNHSINN